MLREADQFFARRTLGYPAIIPATVTHRFRRTMHQREPRYPSESVGDTRLCLLGVRAEGAACSSFAAGELRMLRRTER